jgi:tungstate transport system ATP-binding protein
MNEAAPLRAASAEPSRGGAGPGAPAREEPPAATVLRLRSVVVRFGAVHALAGVDLAVESGARVALVGANGSGKSTLLRVMHGLLEPSAGEVAPVAGVRQAMIFQRPHMMRASVQTNVALGLWLQGRRWRDASAQALAALQQFGLAPLARRSARTLSGGQQQRLAIARACAVAPNVLLLDEPTSSLDPHAKREVEALVAELVAQGLTIVFASHNLGQVKRLASRVVYLEQGRVIADLPVARFFNGPLPESAQQFLKGEL